MDDWDKILSDVALEETKDEFQDEWWCRQCEHGPMNEKDDKTEAIRFLVDNEDRLNLCLWNIPKTERMW